MTRFVGGLFLEVWGPISHDWDRAAQKNILGLLSGRENPRGS